MQRIEEKIQNNVDLAPLTTIGLGGKAKIFLECKTHQDIIDGVLWVKKNDISIHVLAGGSNTIFSDDGFNGLVLHIGLKGIKYSENKEFTDVAVAAGVKLDDFVAEVVKKGLTGVECLSGIPGSVGATPIQNVGAYGQEISETIQKVKTINTLTGNEEIFSKKECLFGYRTSRFKQEDKGKYIVIEVIFRLKKDVESKLRYPELAQMVKEKTIGVLSKKEQLEIIRNTVLELRRHKSMIEDKNDPNAKSCGSFFVNPVVAKDEYKKIEKKMSVPVPHFISGDDIKIPAAWIIEQAGFNKGYTEGGVGISEKHNLAIINKDGTTKEVLALAQKIQEAVKEKFKIELLMEPIIV